MAIEVMNRAESKYLVNTATYLKLMNTIEKYTDLDQYNKKQDFYTISNIYYDTDDNNLIRTSLSKPEYKEKIRLRAYGVPTELDDVFVEIKKKYRKTVNKRRVTLHLPDSYEFLESYHIPETKNSNRQIATEIKHTLKRYQPKPKVYIAYDRRAYIGENGLRITFDTNIRTRRNDLKLELGDYGQPLLDKDIWLLETKTEGAFPLWLARLFAENKVFAQSFSKYGTEYKQYLENGGTNKCLNQSSALRIVPQHLLLAGKTLSPQFA